MNVYSDEFFKNHIDGSRRSANVIVPMVVDLVQPKSVIDVGCGLGAWLAAFREAGVTDIMGIDLDYIDRTLLLIDRQDFRSFDFSKPFRLDRSFDLVVSLEVAEHLPEHSAESFVSSLVGLGNVILFSAAIPGQGGTNHVNEQWQVYWRNQFAVHQYEMIDCFRSKIWDNDQVQIHYRQNLLLFVARHMMDIRSEFSEAQSSSSRYPLSVVHPALWEAEHLNVLPTIGGLLRELPNAASRSISKRFRRK